MTPLTQPALDGAERKRLAAGEHREPHDVLGAHPARLAGIDGIVVRAFHPDAIRVDLLGDGDPRTLEAEGDGLFATFVPGATLPMRYRLRFHFPNGETWERGDPYRHVPTVGELDIHLFAEGTHRRLWQCLGARLARHDGEDGVAFAVWAPHARRVSLVGDFCGWDGRLLPMRALGSSGIFELFVPGLEVGTLYKYEILTQERAIRLKSDPLGLAMERPPSTASRVAHLEGYAWGDTEWMAHRRTRDPERDPEHGPGRAPMLIYEVHLGSWRRVPEEGDRPLTYRELATELVDHVRRLGFTHIELLPVMEHPFDGSWGYQVTGYYAPTSRFGTPDDFRFFVDACHQAGIGVILDWVPAHFPRDDFALRRFDGTALYEHDDPRLGEHPDWGTLIFNYGRHEVRSFLIANAVYWLDIFHVDGLRVDAVASMLYLDYSRREGEWLPNRYGGRENLDAVDFLRALNDSVAAECPGTMVIAEESTAWPGVTRPTAVGGLGFTFKWNMGWMHDTLDYFSHDPAHRAWHHERLTFAMLYEWGERYVNPLSHDEVVHGKRSLLEKMPGDEWQKFANLRLLLAYQYTRPGKVLLFMGTELAPWREWNHQRSLDWHLAEDPRRAGLSRFMADLGRLTRDTPALWRGDPDPESFAWIDCTDRQNSVVSFVRRDGDAHVVVVLNLTPVPRDDYRIGLPRAGAYRQLLNGDDSGYGGSGFDTPARLVTEAVPWHGHAQSARFRLPPLGALVLAPEA
jgi:1,4-alpha-glucan branching enzyme